MKEISCQWVILSKFSILINRFEEIRSDLEKTDLITHECSTYTSSINVDISFHTILVQVSHIPDVGNAHWQNKTS